jgi:hypothetical protein
MNTSICGEVRNEAKYLKYYFDSGSIDGYVC